MSQRARTVVLSVVLVFAAHFLFVTRFTGNIFHGEEKGTSFDSLALHLTNFEVWVDPDTIEGDGFTCGDRTCIYQGLWPALVRLPILAVMPSKAFQLSRISCLLAAIILMAAFMLLTHDWIAAAALGEWEDRALRAALFLGFGLGTPVVFLLSYGWLFHEVLLWASAASFWCFLCYWRLIETKRPKFLVLMCVAWTVALLTRVTFALPLSLLVMLACYDVLRTGLTKQQGRKTLLVLAGAFAILLAGVTLQGWYNFARFGSITKFIDYGAYYLKPDEIGGEFNLLRVPSTLWNYFGFSFNSFSAHLPFFRVSTPVYFNTALFILPQQPVVISLWIVSPWLLVCSLRGYYFLAKRREWHHLLVGGILLTQFVPIATFYFIAHRYTAEFLLFLTFGLYGYIRQISERGQADQRKALSILLALVLIAIMTTMLSSLSYTMTFG